MVTHMKTTIDIADALLLEAKATATRNETTLRALVEEGLRLILEKKKQHSAFRLRDASFRGRGLQPEVKDGSWERIRDLAYEGRGS